MKAEVLLAAQRAMKEYYSDPQLMNDITIEQHIADCISGLVEKLVMPMLTEIEVLYCSDKFITYKFLASNGEVTMPLSKFEDSYSYCELINEPPQEHQPKSCEGCEWEKFLNDKEDTPCETCRNKNNYQPKQKRGEE